MDLNIFLLQRRKIVNIDEFISSRFMEKRCIEYNLK